MKKLLILALVLLCVGCEQGDRPQNHFAAERLTRSPGTLTELLAVEYCYKGVKYVQFGGGTTSWGGVMLDKNSNVVICS